jgi:amidase
MAELWSLSAGALAAMVARRETSAREVAESALSRLAAANPVLNAVVDLFPEETLAEADRVDAAIAAGAAPGPLAGVPVTVKVNVDQAGRATTNGLRVQADRIAAQDSPVVANLRRAGAVILGRTNTPAFSIRWFTRNSLHGATRNPHDARLTPGGSSGGAAAAVAAGIGAIAHGTDIAGSIRYPAYACGVHGLRPTVGRVPAHNASGPERTIGAQLTVVSGPLARSIADLRLATGAMAAGDPRDPWWMPVADALPPLPRRVALWRAPEGLAVDPGVAAAIEAAARALEAAGWQVEEAEPPGLREAARLNMALWMGELRAAGPDAAAREGDPDALALAPRLVAAASDKGSVEEALTRRTSVLRAWQLFLAEHPLVLCPVSAERPFPDHLDIEGDAAFARILEAQLTQIALPVLGLPALAVSTGRPGAPIGVQLVGPRFREDLLLEAGAAIEAAHPPVRAVDPFVAGERS